MLIKKVLIDKANRLYKLPPEILAFVQTDRSRTLIRRADLIDLASFRWPVTFDEFPLPDAKGLQLATRGQLANLKEEIVSWLGKRCPAKLTADKDVFVGGSVTALIHQIALAYVDNGDVAFVPELGLPLYRAAVTACNGEPIGYTVSAKYDWLPQFDRLTTDLGRVARLMFLNSPHNPTGAELGEKEMTEVAWLAGRENILLVNDAAYAGIPQRPPVSLLSVRGGKKVGVEVYSFSYQFGLPPLPFGFVVGNREAIAGLHRTAQLLPTHIPAFYVNLAIQAIRHFPTENLRRVRSLFTHTAAEAAGMLDQLHAESAGFTTVPYLWTQTEKRIATASIARQLFKRYRILVAPGSAFGENGESYLRFSLTAGAEDYKTAAGRIKRRALIPPREDT